MKDEYEDIVPSRSDIYWHEKHGKGMFGGSSSGNGYGWRTYLIDFEDGESDYMHLSWVKILFDHRIQTGDHVDIRRENNIVLRGTVVEIKPEEDKPYCISGNGALVWMAAHEFERFVRADAPERAYKTLTAVRARIEILEAELTALKLTEEVLEGVYI